MVNTSTHSNATNTPRHIDQITVGKSKKKKGRLVENTKAVSLSQVPGLPSKRKTGPEVQSVKQARQPSSHAPSCGSQIPDTASNTTLMPSHPIPPCDSWDATAPDHGNEENATYFHDCGDSQRTKRIRVSDEFPYCGIDI